jgi:hypothetical protein
MTTNPERVVGFWERLALENPDECTLRWWVIPLARLEGLVFLTLSERETSGARFEQFLGVLGIPALLFPKQYIDWSTKLAYEDPDRCEWRSWIVPFTRIVGAVYVLAGIRGSRDRRR